MGLHRVLQPKPEGEQRMARRQRGIVIIGPALVTVAAVGRQRHGDGAEPAGTEAERAVAKIGIVFGCAPGGVDLVRDVGGQLGEERGVVRKRERRRVRAVLQRIEQYWRTGRYVRDGVARLFEIGEQREHAGRHVEADRVACASARARIIGHHHGDAPHRTRRLLEPHERGDLIRDGFDAVRLRGGSHKP